MLVNPLQRMYSEVRKYVEGMHIQMQTTFEMVRKDLEKVATLQECQLLKKSSSRNKDWGFSFVHFPSIRTNECKKFVKNNRDPYRVLKRFNNIDYEVESMETPEKRIKVFVDRM